jgi:hypothetical protein
MRYLRWTCAAAAVALAGDVAAAQVSHLGQNVADHVMLRSGTPSGRFVSTCPVPASPQGMVLFRVWPDGTRESESFTVPSGRLLVITDVEWTVMNRTNGGALTAGATVRFRLQIGSGTTFSSVFLSPTVEVGSERAAVSGSEQLTTGIAVGPNTTICPSAVEFIPNGFASAWVNELVLRGYLITAH